MDIAVVTLVAGKEYSKAVRLATKSKEDYSKIHGYDIIVGNDTDVDNSRPVAWSKIPLLRRLLPGYDFVFWSDADAMFVDYQRRLEEFFSGFIASDKMMVVTKDAKNHVNTGNFLLRNNLWSLSLLDEIWQQNQFINHGWWDNAAFIHLLGLHPRIAQKVAVVPNHHLPFNSYPHHNDYVEGDFIVHFAGVHDLSRLEQLTVRFYKPLGIQLEQEISGISVMPS